MMNGYDLGAGLTGCESGIDERPREEGLFHSAENGPFSDIVTYAQVVPLFLTPPNAPQPPPCLV
jgi:hypothetical protein